jgi:hypothetical protein
MRRIKFSLRGLILFMTAVGLFLGYSQYRRHCLREECARITDEDFHVSMPDGWIDHVWQRPPTVVISLTALKVKNSGWTMDVKRMKELGFHVHLKGRKGAYVL